MAQVLIPVPPPIQAPGWGLAMRKPPQVHPRTSKYIQVHPSTVIPDRMGMWMKGPSNLAVPFPKKLLGFKALICSRWAWMATGDADMNHLGTLPFARRALEPAGKATAHGCGAIGHQPLEKRSDQRGSCGRRKPQFDPLCG